MDFSLFENQHWHRQKWFEEKELFVVMKMGLKCKYQILYNILVTDDTYREKLCFTQFSTRMAAWLLLTFFTCLHKQLNSVHSIITYLTSTDV